MLEQIETKLDTGLDRSINAIIGWVKIYLQSEQRKTDFKPESDFDTVASTACQNVVQQIIPIIKQIQTYLDGENHKSVMNEIGIRLHRTIYEHLQQFQFTTAGKSKHNKIIPESPRRHCHLSQINRLVFYRCYVCNLRC